MTKPLAPSLEICRSKATLPNWICFWLQVMNIIPLHFMQTTLESCPKITEDGAGPVGCSGTLMLGLRLLPLLDSDNKCHSNCGRRSCGICCHFDFARQWFWRGRILRPGILIQCGLCWWKRDNWTMIQSILNYLCRFDRGTEVWRHYCAQLQYAQNCLAVKTSSQPFLPTFCTLTWSFMRSLW